MTGHQAILLAALRSGCNCIAQTAAFSPEGTLVSSPGRKPWESLVQAETEIDAVGRSIAVAASGGIGLALTSGPGLAACGENLTFAALAELPLVLVHRQHLGADNGDVVLPGDTDVSLARHLLAGDLPLPVLAAADVASSYRLTAEALNLARRLRMPIILLVSPLILAAQSSFEPPEPHSPPAADSAPCGAGVSPAPARRRRHGEQKDSLLRPSSEALPDCVHFFGRVNGRRLVLNVDPATIEARLKSLRDKVLNQGEALEYLAADPDPDAETLLLSYGLADEPARRAVATVRRAGARVSHLTVYSLWPVPQRSLRRAMTPYVRRVLIPEHNLGLYADELRKMVRGVKIESLSRSDGRLIEPQAIAERITAWPCG